MYSLPDIPKKGQKMKFVKSVIAIILIIIGIIILLYPKMSNYIEQKNQIEFIKEYKENISKMESTTKDEEYLKAEKYNEYLNGLENKNSNYEEILNISKNGIMAYIEIPKISVYLPIYHGTKEDILKKGIGHLENSSLPIGGVSTHTVLTGHTGLLKAELFTRIRELEIDDYFYVYTLGQKLTYKVYQIKVVLPTEVDDVKIQEGKDLVSLVTCTPYGVNTHRLLVQAIRTENIEENNLDSNQNESLENDNQSQENYYIKGLKYGLTMLIIIIFCCILFNIIVKYIQKVRNR